MMKRFFLFCVAMLAPFSTLLPHSASAQEAKVLLVMKDGTNASMDLMLKEEVGVMTSMLEAAGLQVVVASPSGEPIAGEELSVTPDMKLADVDMVEFSGIMMPCLAMGFEPEPVEAYPLVKEALAQGKPVAAQMGSVVTLVEAGVLEGKKFSFVEEWMARVPQMEGRTSEGHGVVEDGNVLTSGVCPFAARTLNLEDGTPALTKAFIAKISG